MSTQLINSSLYLVDGVPVIKRIAIVRAAKNFHKSRSLFHRWEWRREEECSECFCIIDDALDDVFSQGSGDDFHDELVTDVLMAVASVPGVKATVTMSIPGSNRMKISVARE